MNKKLLFGNNYLHLLAIKGACHFGNAFVIIALPDCKRRVKHIIK
jgi:hypothetical protein